MWTDNLDYRIKILSDDLKLLILPVPHATSFTIIFAVKAGCICENEKNNGTAHFLEHMFFKGTRQRPRASDIERVVESVGGELSAFTSIETTFFYIKVPCQWRLLACNILSDMILNSVFKKNEIEKEKGVIIQEINQYCDDPESFLDYFLWRDLLYGNQPLGRPVIGSQKTVSGFNRQTILDFYSDYYVASNAVICIAGQIPDFDSFSLTVEDLFGGLKAGLPFQASPVVDEQTEPVFRGNKRAVSQSVLILGVKIFGREKEEKLPALDVLSIVLGGNCSSRLFQEIREKRGLAYSVQSYPALQIKTGCFEVDTAVARENVLGVVKIILRQCRDIVEKGITQTELKHARNFLIGTLQMRSELVSQAAFGFTREFLLDGKIETFGENIEKIKQVTCKDVRNLAEEIFRNDKLNLALVGPRAEKDIDKILKVLKF